MPQARPASVEAAPARETRRKKTRASGKTRALKNQPRRAIPVRTLAGAGTLGVLFPFVSASLLSPGQTGAWGRALEAATYGSLGVASLVLPLITLGMGLRMTFPTWTRHLQLTWAPLLLLTDFALLAQRMGGQGGKLGASLDAATGAVIGPVGSWLVALCGLGLGCLALTRIPLATATHALVDAAHWGMDGVRGVVEKIVHDLSWDNPPVEESEENVPPVAPAPKKAPKAETLPAVVEPEPEPGPVRWDSQELAEALDPSSEEWESESEELDEVEEEEEEEDPGPPFEVSRSEENEAPAAPVPPTEAPLPPVCQAGVLEDPDGQLRLFPGPAAAPAARYKLPPLALLDDAAPGLAKRPIEDKSQVLLDALASFGVQASLLQIVRGPAVTRYELQPARGVKVSRFTSLTNDIALALAATAVRIEAPIPGKSAIGIEIPNENTDLVVLKDILGSPRFKKSAGLSIALGKDLQGSATFANLQKMPHLLVAGTTGSGKSVCVNGLILSLLYAFTPRQLQLLMIDPKQVELSTYEGIPHLIGLSGGQSGGQIICDPKRAALALHQVVELMEQRYSQFAAARVRNLDEFNLAATDPLPWVVVIIDELADLMMVASKTVETSICRIAQKARAAGIHLVVATQRPSADVITGLIKVNIPSRIAFAVSSQVDSRVILDTGGAEQLLGKGDMLFLPVDASDPRRVQGAYVTNEEILRVVEFWKGQASPENLIELSVGEAAEESEAEEEGDEDDNLVEQALQVICRRQQASASLLQTELKVGYARARRLIYLMEKKGYIGPAEGSKPRKILYGGGG